MSYAINDDTAILSALPVDTMAKVAEEFQLVIDADNKNDIPKKYEALAEKLSSYLEKNSSAA